jgi:hypothetical protein
MNFYKRPFHHNNSSSNNPTPTSIRDSLNDSSSSSSSSAGQTSSPLNGSVRFNDLISAQPKFNEREKYLTA